MFKAAFSRPLLIGLFAVFIFSVQVNDANSQQLVSPNKTLFDFGIRPVSPNPVFDKLSLRGGADQYWRIIGVNWKSGVTPPNFSFNPAISIGDIVPDSGKNYAIEAIFNQSELVKDTLVLDIECGDGGRCEGVPNQTIEIEFLAKVDCIGSDPDCEPKGPQCTIDFNNEPYVQFSVPDFEIGVRSAIEGVVIKHYAGFKTYSLPLDTVWGLSGLSPLFDELNGPCCQCAQTCPSCSTGACEPDMDFVIDFNYPGTARFTWNSADGDPRYLQSKLNPMYDIEIEIPSKMTGSAIVGAGYVELHYSSEAEAPKMSMRYIGPPGDNPFSPDSLLYDGSLRCTGTSFEQAVVLHPYSSGNVPTIHLRSAAGVANP